MIDARQARFDVDDPLMERFDEWAAMLLLVHEERILRARVRLSWALRSLGVRGL